MAFGIGQLLRALDLENRFAQYLQTGSLSSFITSLLGASNQATAQALLGLGPYATLTSIPTPTNPTDPANKSYVDALSQGLNIKPSALVATTANITLSGEQTIDGVLTSASIVLVRNQTTASQNGLYTSASGAWSRIAAMNTWAQVPGAFTFVEQGTVNADTGWVCTSAAGGTLGTTAIAWSKFSTAGGSLVASNNLSDLGSAATARTNLGLGALATLASITSSLISDATTAGLALLTAVSVAAQRTALGLGSAALLTAGTAANNAVQLDGSAKLPAVDGSALTNLPSTGGITSLGTQSTPSGTSQSLTGLTLTSYKFLRIVVNGITGNNSGTILTFNGIAISAAMASARGGFIDVDLTTGVFGSFITGTAQGGASGLSTASTSVTLTVTGMSSAFSGGLFTVYGIK